MENFYDDLRNKLSNEESLDGLQPDALWDKITGELDTDMGGGHISDTSSGLRNKFLYASIVILFLGITTYFLLPNTSKNLAETKNIPTIEKEPLPTTETVVHPIYQTLDAYVSNLENERSITTTQTKTDKKTSTSIPSVKRVNQYTRSNTSSTITNTPIATITINSLGSNPNDTDEVKTQNITSEHLSIATFSQNRERAIGNVNLSKQSIQVPTSSTRALETTTTNSIERNNRNIAQVNNPKTITSPKIFPQTDEVNNSSGTALAQAKNQRNWKALSPVESKMGTQLASRYMLTIPIMESTKIYRHTSLQKCSIHATAGVNRLSTTFGTINDSLDIDKAIFDTTYTERLGYTASVGLQYRIHPNFFVATGFEYHTTKHRFDVVLQSDTMIANPNPSTIDRIAGVTTRTVRHHNTMNHITVPVILGYSKRINRWEIGVKGGIGLNFVTNQLGKTVNPNLEIVSYNTSSKAVPYNTFFVSYQVSPFVNYHMTRRFALQIAPTVRYQTHGTSDVWKVKHSSLQTNVNAGVIWKL